MIPQIGFTELLLVGALALIIVGPKDLPLMMRKVGKLWGQARGLAREFQSSFEELGRQAEIEELRKEVEALKRGEKGHQLALAHYTAALALGCKDAKLSAVIHSNRSQVALSMKEYAKALDDAAEAVTLDPEHLKSYFRGATAAIELERWLGGLPPVVAAEDAVEMPSGRGGGRTSSFIRASKALDRLSRA